MSSTLLAALRRGSTAVAAVCTRSAVPVMQVRMLSGATPVSRKTLRRLNAALDNASTEIPSDFHQLAKEFFDAVEQAVEPMKQKNPGMTVTRLENGLNIELAEGKGTYMFQMDYEVSTITLQSPMSGAQQYRYDTETKQWVSTSDDHDVRGLLTRDLIRQCVGYPEFP